MSALEAEKATLASELEQVPAEQQAAAKVAEAKRTAKLQDQLVEKAAGVEKLKASIRPSEQAKQLVMIETTTRVEKERDRLKAELEPAEAQKALGEKALQEKYEPRFENRGDVSGRLRDMRAKLSNMTVGERPARVSRLGTSGRGSSEQLCRFRRCGGSSPRPCRRR